MFEGDFAKLLVLAVLGLIIFGPERLPGLAAQAGRMLREVRRQIDGAKSELRENLGPEFSQFDLTDLNPKRFVRKHLVDELTGDGVILHAIRDVRGAASGVAASVANGGVANGGVANGGGPTAASRVLQPVALAPGERPPYDDEAT